MHDVPFTQRHLLLLDDEGEGNSGESVCKQGNQAMPIVLIFMKFTALVVVENNIYKLR